MSLDIVTFGCRLNIAEFGSDPPRRGRTRRCGGGEHLRGDGGSGAPGAAEHPPPQARTAGRAHRRHRLRGADRAGAVRGDARGRPCARQHGETRSARLGRRPACGGRRHHGGETPTSGRRSIISRAIPARSCRCRTAAITAAPSASSRSGAAIRGRCRRTKRWHGRAAWSRAAIARSCSPASTSPAS